MQSDQKECPGCAVQVDADAEICPICSYEFPKQSTGVKVMAWLMIILLLLWLLL